MALTRFAHRGLTACVRHFPIAPHPSRGKDQWIEAEDYSLKAEDYSQQPPDRLDGPLSWHPAKRVRLRDGG